jgi:hypothetical protein
MTQRNAIELWERKIRKCEVITPSKMAQCKIVFEEG